MAGWLFGWSAACAIGVRLVGHLGPPRLAHGGHRLRRLRGVAQEVAILELFEVYLGKTEGKATASVEQAAPESRVNSSQVGNSPV